MAITRDVYSLTLEWIAKQVRDGLYKSTPFLDNATKSGAIEHKGGRSILRPIMLAEHSVINAHPTGWEPSSLVFKDVVENAAFDWADFSSNIGVNTKEMTDNDGPEQVVSILEPRTRAVLTKVQRDLNKQLIQGNVAPFSGILNTLNGSATHGEATGFLEALAPAAQVNTVGGLDKAAYGVNGLLNQYQTAAGAFSTNGHGLLQQLLNDTKEFNEMGTSPNLALFSSSGFANYRRAFFPRERYVSADMLDSGRLSLAFGNGIAEQDSDMPTGAANSEYSAYILNFDSVKMVIHPEQDLKTSDFIPVPGSTVKTAMVYWKGQLVFDNLSGCGVLVGGDTW